MNDFSPESDSSPFSLAPTLRFPTVTVDDTVEERVPASQNDVALVATVLVEDGSRAWPSVVVSVDQLVSLLGPRLVAKGAALSPELYLVAGCLRGDRFALAILDGEYLAKVRPHVQSIAAKRGGDVDELVAELRSRLLRAQGARAPRLMAYSGRGLLSAWLRVVAVRFALEGYRAPAPAPRVRIAEQDYAKVLSGTAFRAALEAGFAALPPDQRAVLRLVYEDRLTGDRAAKSLGVGTSTVTRRLGRGLGGLLEVARAALVAEGIGGRALDRAGRDLLAHVQAALGAGLASTAEP